MKRFLTLLLLVGVCLFASAQSIIVHHKDGNFYLPTQKIDSISFDMKYRDSMDTTLLHKHITVNDTTVNQVILNDTLWKKINVTDTVVSQIVLNDTLWRKITLCDTTYNHVTLNDTVDYLGGHRFVDLGLSVKWASCNVGSNNPEGYGLYFAWGETQGYSTDTSDGHLFDFFHYKWYNCADSVLTKYCLNDYNGTVDNLKILESKDDAATVNWGAEWRIPTVEELKELTEKCTWTWTAQNGVNGYKVAGTNGNSIFLPSAGYRVNNMIVDPGVSGFYWSNSLIQDAPADALEFANDGIEYDSNIERSMGVTIRPVCSLETRYPATCSFGCENYSMKVGETYSQTLTTNSDGVVTYSSSDPSIASVDASTGVVTALKAGSVIITAKVESSNYEACSASYNITIEASSHVINTNGHDYVDLGLSVMWATKNIGASSSEDYGDYFAWGETKPKTTFSWSNYVWCDGTQYSLTKYCSSSANGNVDNLNVLDPADDAANAYWGGDWRMPTREEFDELVSNCYWEWVSSEISTSGCYVYKVKSDSDKGVFKAKDSNVTTVGSYTLSDPHIFLPANGYYDGSSISYKGLCGSYWLNSCSSDSEADTYCFFYNMINSNKSYKRYAGFGIRAVCK